MSAADALPENPVELARFAGLELIARQLVEGLIMGRHRSPFKGASVEFVEHRKYYPGDEIRHIDWRAYGKTGRYYIKEFEDETNVRAQLLLDLSGSMKYAGAHLSKFSYARIVAASLSWLLLTQRDSVGLITFDSRVRSQLRPSSKRDTWHEIIRTLESSEPGDETSLTDVIDTLLPSLPRRSLLILISDCFDSLPALENVLQRCRHARHELIVFRIAAPEEEEFPFERPTQFHDLEDPAHRLLADPVRLRQEYLQQYRRFAETLARTCGNLGIDYCRILTNEPPQQALGRWLASRLAATSPHR